MSIDQILGFLQRGIRQVSPLLALLVAALSSLALWAPPDVARALRIDRITSMTLINEGYLQLGFWVAVILLTLKGADLGRRFFARLFRVAERQELAAIERRQVELLEKVSRLSAAQVRLLQPVAKGERVVFALREDYGHAESLVKSGVLERMPEGDEGTKRAYLVREEAAIAMLKSDKLVH